MQLIDCPWCGPREEIEFHYGGEAHVPYPENSADLDDTEWAHFVFTRNNTRGPFAERWSHHAGCRRWFNAIRDTVSYEFLTIYRPDESIEGRPEVKLLSPAQQELIAAREARLAADRSSQPRHAESESDR